MNPKLSDATSNDDDEVLSITDLPLPKSLWMGMLVSLGFLWLPVLLGILWSPFGDGVRLMVGTKPLQYTLDPLIYLVVYAVVLQVALSTPVGMFAFPQIKRFPFLGMRWGMLFFLLSAPLLSFAYYKTGKMSEDHVTEIFLAVVPAAFLATVYFEKWERKWLITAWLTLGTFVPIFFINDLMGPYSTYFAYASRFEAFYYLRFLGPALSVIAGLFFSAKAQPAME